MRRFSPWRIFLRLLRFLLLGLIAFMVIFLAGRMIAHNHDPKEVKLLTCDEPVVRAYAEYGDKMQFYTQSQGTYTRAERNAGYFFIRQAIIIPEAHEIQIVFRYNDSTVKALTEDYGIAAEALPDPSEHVYDVSIVLKQDLTPDNPDDANEEGAYTLVRYFPVSEETFKRGAYNYRRLVFHDIDITDLTLGAFVDIYYTGDIDYASPAYGTLCIWDFESVDHPYSLSSADKKALAGK